MLDGLVLMAKLTLWFRISWVNTRSLS